MERKEVFRGSGTIVVVQNMAPVESAAAETGTEIVIESGNLDEDTIVVQPVVETESPKEEPAEQPVVVVPEELKAQLDRIEEAQKASNHKDELIRNLHKEMENLKGDLYASLKRPIIKSIISIDKRMKERQAHMARLLSQPAETLDYSALLTEFIKNFDFDRTSILDALEDEYDLIYFEPTVGAAYNPKEENAVQIVETPDPALGGTVKEVLYGGFRNAENEKVFLKANIVVYRLKQS